LNPAYVSMMYRSWWSGGLKRSSWSSRRASSWCSGTKGR